MVMTGVVREARSAFGTQPGTVRPAYGLEGQCEHDRIHEHGLEVDVVALNFILFGLLIDRPRLAMVGDTLGMNEELLEVRSPRR